MDGKSHIDGGLVSRARKRQGLSVEDLAARAHVDASRVELLEESDPRLPFTIVARVADALSLDVEAVWGQDLPAVPPTVDEEASQAPPSLPRRRVGVPHQPVNAKAIVSFVLAVVPGGALLAVIFGHLARREIERSAVETGEGYALWGLILGYSQIVIVVLLLLAASGDTGGTAL